MTLSPGTRLGPYEILSSIGAGGMGEVYRARDVRLGREVAIKVLPQAFSSDGERLARFEREARAASSLNHPNILTIHDVGTAEGRAFLTMELVEGKSLRDLLQGGPLPLRKGLELSEQIASGLAAAHEKGIVHRDLKPENILLTKSGQAKIADFGLAKLMRRPEENAEPRTWDQRQTSEGVILGTVGYMSPEQATGKPVDYRSDQFAFGAVGYEMATGRRAFSGNSPAEVLTAIIREEPAPVASLNQRVPAPVTWIIERCLSKDPEDRYASTRDLARDLKSLRDHFFVSSGAGSSPPSLAQAPSRKSRFARAIAAAAAAITLAAIAFVGGRRSGIRPVPRYTQLSFRRGTIWNSRFQPDGHTVLYGASFEGNPVEIFEKREGGPESRPLGLPGANLLSIGRNGQLAISLGDRISGPYVRSGTLAELSPGGTSAPHELLANICGADWGPDGTTLAVVRVVGGEFQIEYPVGTVLYRTAGWINHARVSRDGQRVAFLDHPVPNDDGGSVAVVDRQGHYQRLATGFQTAEGLCWSPDGREVWFTANPSGQNLRIYAVSLDGKERVVDRAPGMLLLWDMSAHGKVLASRDTWRDGLSGRLAGDAREVDLSWLDWSLAADISKDGTQILFMEAGEGGGPGYSVYVRKGASPATRLGEGFAQAFSPDLQSVVAIRHSTSDPQLAIYPTGVGEPRLLPRNGLAAQRADWMPDGKRLLVSANEAGKGVRLWVVDAVTGEHRPVSPEGFRQFSRCVLPDGSKVLAEGPDRRVYLYPLDGGKPAALPNLTTEDLPSGWLSDGRTFLVYRRNELPARIYSYDSLTGTQRLWREVAPPDPAGIIQVNRFMATPDGAAYVYNYQRFLSELFEIEGLK